MTAPMSADASIRSAMVELIQGPANETALERTLLSITSSAVELIDGVDYAGVFVIHEGESRSVAATGPLIVELDAVQLQLKQGPCLEAAVGGAMIRCTDMREERRWPAFAPAAVTAGVLGALSYQLFPSSNATAALTLFGRDTRMVDEASEAMGAILATMATVALMTAATHEQFEAALASRDIIGQAKGILMNHYKIDADPAFEMLKDLSQRGNTPLRVIAQRIIEDS
jgi:hypothetical protein